MPELYRYQITFRGSQKLYTTVAYNIQDAKDNACYLYEQDHPNQTILDPDNAIKLASNLGRA